MSEYIVSIKIEKLDEGVYLATSDTLQGLVAQGRTIAETMEIAQDVAKKLIESSIERGDPLPHEMTPAASVVRNIKIEIPKGTLKAILKPDRHFIRMFCAIIIII